MTTLPLSDKPKEARMNGNGGIPQWAWAAVLGLVMFLLATVATSNANRIDTLESDSRVQGQAISALRADYVHINTQLDRMEDKLDRLTQSKAYGP